ncbi:MAG: hypothetical protein AAF702_32915 [Chloroflexota bacterium]
MNEATVRLLSDAQRDHYAALIQAREGIKVKADLELKCINEEIQRFASFLGNEHQLDGDGWVLHHDRFVKEEVAEPEPVAAQEESDIPL